jgi:hypothetical protein
VGQILQAQLEEERRQCLELDARMRSEQQRTGDILRYIQSATGVAPPPSLFTPNPPPSQFSTPVSMTVLVCMFMLRVKPLH